jgi:hypothetical protein
MEKDLQKIESFFNKKIDVKVNEEDVSESIKKDLKSAIRAAGKKWTQSGAREWLMQWILTKSLEVALPTDDLLYFIQEISESLNTSITWKGFGTFIINSRFKGNVMLPRWYRFWLLQVPVQSQMNEPLFDPSEFPLLLNYVAEYIKRLQMSAPV